MFAIVLILLVGIFGLITAVAILFYRDRSSLGVKLIYAIFAMLAPFLLMVPMSWLVPKNASSWLENSMLIVVAISPYLVRALYVFNYPRESNDQSTS